VDADLKRIREAFCQRAYLFTSTGGAKMLKLGLTAEQIEGAICGDAPEIIEDYPDDERGPACLILCWADKARPLHVVIGYGYDPDVVNDVVTVYAPDDRQWYNYRVRR
jgi:hypothetical protein